MRKFALFLFAIAAPGAVIGSQAIASEIVYHPTNPTFGGNPLNGTPLLSQAQAQGVGVKSGSQGPDLSGLNNALSNLGSTIVVTPTNNGTGGTGSTSNNTPAQVP